MMKTFWREFKGFAFKGNMLDLAVAVVIGTAFGAVVNALVKNIIMPLVSYILPHEENYRAWLLGRVEVGAFLGELMNFLIVALAVYVVIVKTVGSLLKRVAPPPTAAEPVSKECPFCLSNIPIRAVKCGHCTSDLPQPEAG